MYTPTKFWEQSIQIAPSDLATFTQCFIEEIKRGDRLTNKGVRYSDSAITSYKNMLDYLCKFEKIHQRQFLLNEINYTFAEKFELFLTSEGLALNSVGVIMAKLKAIMKVAWQKGLALWNGTGFSAKTERTTKTYLSMSEIAKMHQCRTLTTSQTTVLYVFTIQCFTGFRYDTLCKFLENPLAYIKEFNGYSYIEVVSGKTKETSVVPLSSIVVELLNKHKGKMPIFSERYINRTIKVVAKKAGLDNTVVLQQTKGGKATEILTQKCETISTHTARRTLISLLRTQNFSNAEIQAISGHTTEAQMLEYDRSSKAEKIKNLLNHPFFSKNLHADF